MVPQRESRRCGIILYKYKHMTIHKIRRLIIRSYLIACECISFTPFELKYAIPAFSVSVNLILHILHSD